MASVESVQSLQTKGDEEFLSQSPNRARMGSVSPDRQKQHERRSSPSPLPEPRSGENRLRPAGDIINRITWDSNFDRNDFIIGFVDRFEGQLEVTLDSWKKESTDEEFIPQHRVLYIRHLNGDIVWDRRRRIDKIFNSGNSAFSELAFLQ